MKAVKYPESIFCAECHEHVKMTNCRISSLKVRGRGQVEFDYACVSCGHRDSAVRDMEFLQFSEREFCQKSGLVGFEAGGKKQGVVHERKSPKKSGKVPAGKYG